MSETNPPNLRAIEGKLRNLLSCILDRATKDATFAHQLEEIFLTDSFRKTTATKKKKTQGRYFNAVEFLHVNGEAKLRAALDSKTDSELRLILRSDGIRKGQDLKSIERPEMIDEIVRNAERRLKQGSSFLMSQQTDDLNPR